MNFKISLGAAIAFALTIAALTYSITMTYSTRMYNEKMSSLRERETANGKFAEIDREVRSNFYGTMNQTQLMDSVARGYMAGIGDTYAQYITAEEYARQNQGTDATVGIGAELETSPDGYLLVTEVYNESPAQVAGILPGDLIVNIDETDLTPENSSQQLSMIQGVVGTKVTVTIRSGANERVEEMTRREVYKTTVYSRMLGNTGIGYILITEFTDRTANQFNRELGKLQSAGARGIVFDLRDNRGGVLRQAARVLNHFVPAGSLVSAKYRNGSIVELENSDGNYLILPIVVLTNKNTSGAAEVFTQVLRDYNRGKSVGTTTAGKGVMQETIKLSDGSAIKITVAHYITPSGEDFNGIGVKPDFEVTISSELEANWRELDHETDPQLNKALSVAESLVNASDVQQAKDAAMQASQEQESSSQQESISPPQAEIAS